MNFTEGRFVYFFLIVYALWLCCRGNYRARLVLLTVSSLIFYAYHEWRIVFLILAYCVVDWLIGLWLARTRFPTGVVSLGVGFNLAVLCFWKYTPLLLRSLAWIALRLDIPAPPVPEHWFLPLGISFYSFTGIAYMVDVYRRELTPETSLWRFTLYKTFFPQLVAGPILRPRDFLGALQPQTLPNRPEAPLEASLLIARGFFKKMVLADRIGLAIDPYFVHVSDLSTAGVWALPYVYLYALQIYFDFSGYTDIARGLGLAFGFRWPENFNLPYLAGSVQEFWQRWHITLSQFLRDYLYIPLGGSRRGPRRTSLNLMATMLLGGMWHGASWTFLIWGGLHGLYLIGHRWWSGSALGLRLRALEGMPAWLWRGVSVLLTFQCVCLAWCFFRLNALGEVFACLRRCVTCEHGQLFAGGSADLSLWCLLGGYGLLIGGIAQLRQRPAIRDLLAHPEQVAPLYRGFAWGMSVALFLLAILLTPTGEKPPFIYFQF